MFNFKSQLLGVAAALPVAAAGLLGSAGSAQAYTGGFSFDGDATNATLSNTAGQTKFDFFPIAPNTLNRIELGAKFGSFALDTHGTIFDVTSPSGLPSLFIDIDGLNDGSKELTLTQLLSPTFTSVLGGVEISFDFHGLFEDGTKAVGNIDFTALGFLGSGGKGNVSAVQNAFNTTTGVSAVFKGVTVAAVPEPTTILGLGLVGAGMAFANRRKLVKA
jgi:hypothetical protein